MLCEACKKNEAIIHIEEKSQVGVRTVSLCLECAAMKGFNIRSQDIQPLINGFVSNLFGSNPQSIPVFNSLQMLDSQCGFCGTSINEIYETSKAGCQECFSEFRSLIESIIESFNESVEYKGKLPENMDKEKKYLTAVLKLKKELRKCVEKEDFKEAAVIRDKIQVLKKNYEGSEHK